MPLTFASRTEKDEVIDLLRKLLQTVMFPHTRIDQREAMMEHIAWMKSQPGDLNVTCKFETMPELQATRLEIISSFKPGPTQ